MSVHSPATITGNQAARPSRVVAGFTQATGARTGRLSFPFRGGHLARRASEQNQNQEEINPPAGWTPAGIDSPPDETSQIARH
jgi:hypothetical protein